MIRWLYSDILFSLHMFVFFAFFFLVFDFSSSSIFVRKDTWYDFIFFFLIYQGLICGAVCDLSLRMFCVHLSRMCILLLLDGMFYKYLLSASGVMHHLRPMFPCWFFCLDNLSIAISRVLKSSTIIMFLSSSPFMAINCSLIYWGTSTLGAYIFCWIVSITYVFWIQVHYQIYNMWIFSPILWFVFPLSWCLFFFFFLVFFPFLGPLLQHMEV